jgi:hypothetical protein
MNANTFQFQNAIFFVKIVMNIIAVLLNRMEKVKLSRNTRRSYSD